MDTHTQKFKVRLGLFILGGLAIFVLAIFIIGKQKNLFNPVFKLSTTFYNISGLEVGSNIRFSGINVGTVDIIEIINDSTVQVDMLIKKTVQEFIKEDSKAGIGSSGIIGDRILFISQGSTDSPLAKDGQQILSVEPVETDAIIASLAHTANNAETISNQLSEIMIKINSGHGTLGRIIHDTLIAENLNNIILNFEKTSEELDKTMVATKKDISDLMKSLQVTAGNAEVSTQQLEDIMININKGNGTAGMLISDTITSDNINQIIVNLKSTSKALDENMEALKQNYFFRGY
ncbi:MAG: MlaD family protein, partial [Bacteroidota bacterium]